MRLPGTLHSVYLVKAGCRLILRTEEGRVEVDSRCICLTVAWHDISPVLEGTQQRSEHEAGNTGLGEPAERAHSRVPLRLCSPYTSFLLADVLSTLEHNSTKRWRKNSPRFLSADGTSANHWVPALIASSRLIADRLWRPHRRGFPPSLPSSPSFLFQ